MRRPLLLFNLLLIPTILLTSCSVDLNPSIMASETQNTVKEVKDYNNEVFAQIQSNIDLLTELRTKIDNKKPPTLDEAIKAIEEVTKSYEDLASQKETIKDNFTVKIQVVKDLQQNVSEQIDTLNRRSIKYQQDLQIMAQTTSDPEILRTRRKALDKAIIYVQNQITLWQNFNSLEGYIQNELSTIAQRINEFISMIESASIVMREGLNLLQLQQDIRNALSLFNVDLPKIQKLTGDMEKSWDNLDVLIQNLTNLTANTTFNTN